MNDGIRRVYTDESGVISAAESFVELVYTPCGIHNFLLAGIKRVACGADFNLKLCIVVG
jgi:hypothetical protein